MVFFVNCYVVFHFQMFFCQPLCKLKIYSVKLGKIYSVKLGNRVCHLFGKELPTLLAICSFCGCFIVFVCFSFLCWGLDVELIISVSEFSYLFCHLLGNGLPALLAICSCCGRLIVFVCLSLWCWGLNVDLIVSLPEFTYLIFRIF